FDAKVSGERQVYQKGEGRTCAGRSCADRTVQPRREHGRKGGASGRFGPKRTKETKRMSIQALDWAFKQNGFSVPATKLVLIALANYADERNTCYPSQAKLASICSLGRRSIITHLQRLRDEGFITWHRTRGSDGRATTNTYQLLIDRKNPPFVDPDMSNFRDESGSEHDIENGPETPCANIAHGSDHVQHNSRNRVHNNANSHLQTTVHSHVQTT